MPSTAIHAPVRRHVVHYDYSNFELEDLLVVLKAQRILATDGRSEFIDRKSALHDLIELEDVVRMRLQPACGAPKLIA